MLKPFNKSPSLGDFQQQEPDAFTDAELMFKDFVFHMESKLSAVQAKAIMAAALNQNAMAHEIVTKTLGKIALQRKGRIDSDKTRLAADGTIIDFKWKMGQVEQSVGVYAL